MSDKEEDQTQLVKSHEELEEEAREFENEIRPHINKTQMYEDSRRQEAARKSVPVEELEEKALVSLAKEGNLKPSKSEQDHAFLLQLLSWFKQSFRWVNSPACPYCGNKTEGNGEAVPLPSETLYGASIVELYRCTSCSQDTRFARYHDPIKLVETREGRCGEWANCFTFYCRAFGYDSRVILDFTDHSWTECFSQFLGRWMHLDPCEGVYNNPLLYENGWNKKLNYCIAISKDGVYDVTKRYTRKWHEVLSRRTIITEPALSSLLANITKECRRSFTSQLLSVIEARDMEESQQLERCLHSNEDEEWSKSRLETDSDRNILPSSSSCPIRFCVDEHVTRIYNAFHPILYQFVNEDLTTSQAVEVLGIIKGLVLNLRDSPFKTRRTSTDSVLNSPICQKLFPSFEEFLDTLSLEKKVNTDGRVEICLGGDPVRTSLALPVALDALDDLIFNVERCEKFSRDSLALPLLRLNRIHSGFVIASSEEFPFGIATSAFDGIRISKWEEPNGARGCWIVYRTPGKKNYELAAYEMMSANDAPERDPMEWIVEGSNDEGKNWQVLDKQTSQVFEDRFQRRTYMITSPSFPSNVFRLRFLAVRDVESTSRLQVGSIDLYARTT